LIAVEKTLFLRNQEMVGLVSTEECVESIEAAYVELGKGEA